MLSLIGEEKCTNSLVDLVLYSESDPKTISYQPSSQIRTKTKRNSMGDDSPTHLLKTLQQKLSSSNRFRHVLILQG